jgi:hypothetical protein
MRVVQVANGSVRRVGIVDEPYVRLLESASSSSVYALVLAAVAASAPLETVLRGRPQGERLEYDALYIGALPWRLLPPIDHPDEPSRCLVSGTGLTHVGSARDRDAMHDLEAGVPTDSMRMFREGLEGGRPGPGDIGVAPEWFYKGTGIVIRAHGEPLVVPPYAEDGGEEAEIAGVYVIDRAGCPCRVGMATGNEFSDHRYEKRNYLHLAASKLRECALGPELVLDPPFDRVAGEAWIERDATRIWSHAIASGEAEMSHSLQNIEHHHFKYEAHRRPGDVHVHFFGAHSLSYGDGITLADGDVMGMRFEGFGRALRNVLRIDRSGERHVAVRSLT